MRHFGANFRKFWKIDPSKYHVFEKKGPIDVPGGLILLPMFAAHPYNHFCIEYPPPPRVDNLPLNLAQALARYLTQVMLTIFHRVTVNNVEGKTFSGFKIGLKVIQHYCLGLKN